MALTSIWNSNRDSLNFIECNLIARSVIQLRRARALRRAVGVPVGDFLVANTLPTVPQPDGLGRSHCDSVASGPLRVRIAKSFSQAAIANQPSSACEL